MVKRKKAHNGCLVVIVAPSGSGKSTLIKMIKKDFPNLQESVSYTTRPMRNGEKEGKHYFYIDIEEFNKRKEQGEFLEWAQVHSNFYGTSKKFVEEEIGRGNSLLFDLDVQGADIVKKHFKQKAQIIFIAPPSIKVLEERLKKRNTDSDQVIKNRLENAKKELLRKDDYDYCVLNDDLQKAHTDLKNIIKKILED